MRAGIPNNTFRVCSGGGPRYPSTRSLGTCRDWRRCGHRIRLPSAGLFGTGQTAFIAAFPEEPSLTTYENPNTGFGGFEPGVFSEVRLWGAGSPATVFVGSFRGTPAQALTGLVSTGKFFHGVVTLNKAKSVRFVLHLIGKEVPPWQVGVVEVRDAEVFYALGSGDSYIAASLMPLSLRLPVG